MRNTSAFQPNGVKNFELASTGLFSDANLISYYKFEGDSTDGIGTDDGTDTSIDYSLDYGKFGQGIRLNATTDKVAFTDWSLGTADWTISFWLNEQTAQTANTYFVAGSNGSNNWGFYIGSGATTKIRINHNNGATDNFFDSNSTFALGAWRHIVYTKSSDTVSLYVDGVFDKSQTGYSARNFGGSGQNNIGAGLGGGAAAAFFDDLAIFTRALTATEIATIYTSSITKAYYPLNGNSNDYSGNTNTGTDTAITYPQGRFGQAAKFNGTTSKIATPSKIVTSGTELTVTCWLKNGNAAQAVDKTVLSNQKDATGGFMVSRSTLSTPNEYSFAYSNGSAYQGYGTGLFAISTKEFEHYTFTLNGADRKIYRNGRLIVSDTLSGNISWTTAQNLHFGINPDNTAGRFWDGSIDEVIIESRAWTAKEIETYYRKSVLNYRQSKFAQFLQSINITDTMSLLDVTTGIRSRVVNVTDTLGMTDTISAIRAYVVNLVDTMNLSETLTGLRSRIASITDSLGLTDTMRARKKVTNQTKHPATGIANTTKNNAAVINRSKS
jgi:hypothetical protein